MRSADLIIAARRRADLSQEQLAARLGRAQSTIARWETGRQLPALEVVHACDLELTVGLARYDESYHSQIARQLLLEPADRVNTLAPPWIAEGFDVIALLADLAEQARFVVVGAVAGALQGWPIMLGWRTVEIVPDESSVRLIEQFATRLAAEPVADDQRDSRRADDQQRSRSWILPSGGQLSVTLLPRGTQGYRDLARDATTMQIASETTVRVASVIDLIRIAESSTDPRARSFTPALWDTLEIQHRRRERAAGKRP